MPEFNQAIETADDLRKKIYMWLSNPDNEDDEIYTFLFDECGVKQPSIHDDESEEPPKKKCWTCPKMCEIKELRRDDITNDLLCETCYEETWGGEGEATDSASESEDED